MDTIKGKIYWDELKTKLRNKYTQITEVDLQHNVDMEKYAKNC
jgi:hypothetical protein